MSGFIILLDPGDSSEPGYTVTVPALTGCVTEGTTFEEAVAMAREAIAVHLDGLRQDGEPIPADPVADALLEESSTDARRLSEIDGPPDRPAAQVVALRIDQPAAVSQR
jgi:antitoxin HicB